MGSKFHFGIWIMVVLSLLVFLKNSNGARPVPDTLSSMEMEKLEKPQRPRVFTSPEELKGYLGALARYYATVSRNRFGKRVEAEHGERYEFAAGPQESVVNPTTMDK